VGMSLINRNTGSKSITTLRLERSGEGAKAFLLVRFQVPHIDEQRRMVVKLE
jgi:hypothetical protein